MSHAILDLDELAVRIATKKPGRNEATLQADIYQFLLNAPLDLQAGDVRDYTVESPVGDRRRIDIEAGQSVFELKRSLRSGSVTGDAELQLAGYVQARTNETKCRYSGVLTDGAEWRLYHLEDSGELELVSRLELAGRKRPAEALTVWLDGVLGTGSSLSPTPEEIGRRLGAGSPGYALAMAELHDLYEVNAEVPTVALKRELWARLLTTAFGTEFDDSSELFVEHTLLVLTAEVIAHAVVGHDQRHPDVAPATLVSGELFTQVAQIRGVVEPDFFDWIIEVDGGSAFVLDLVRRVSRFDWESVEHDVMKTLYESIIDAKQRHDLGEYYTPDWLASRMVSEVVTDPLSQRVLDPSCGSGTFVFHAIRRFLVAADDEGMSNADALPLLCSRVMGLDVHPVAVTLARVTYLLAIGRDRLRDPARPALDIPVYLGDALQWGQGDDLFSQEALTVSTADGLELFSGQLRFPLRLLEDAGRFDELVSEMASRAASDGGSRPSFAGIARRFALEPDESRVLEATFDRMRALHQQGRDHIWGYYVRNLARPAWLASESNHVDVLVGNPPWLSYRYMTEQMKNIFRGMSVERGLWEGKTLATHQDLSSLFVARCTEMYLRKGGRFGFVMPLAVLSRKQYAGFRVGRWPAPGRDVSVRFAEPWDLHKIKPSFFPVPASVIFGVRTGDDYAPIPPLPIEFSGRLPSRNPPVAIAAAELAEERAAGKPASEHVSPYASRFAQGATFTPRMIAVVDNIQDLPMGVGQGRTPVRSRRSPNEKLPWKNLPALEGVVEAQFVRPMHAGETVLPYRTLEPLHAVVPWDGSRLLQGSDPEIDEYPGLASWWRDAEEVWNSNRSNDHMSLMERLDYRRGLSQQFPPAPHRVVYASSGMYMAAAHIDDPRVVIDTKLYWAATATEEEALYLLAVLNSSSLTEAIRPLQSRGEHNPRDFHKYVFKVPFPLFDHDDDDHRALVEAARVASTIAAHVDLPEGSFQSQRRAIREALESSDAYGLIEDTVAALVTSL